MKSRRTSFFLAVLLLATGAGAPLQARSIFDEAERETPAPAAAADEFPLGELVLGKVRAGSDALGRIPPEAQLRVDLSPGTLEWAAGLEAFRYDPASGRFSAAATTGAGRTVAVSGRVAIEVPVAVPVRRIEPGEIVGAADLEVALLPFSAVTPAIQPDPLLIEGSEARRPLMAGRPVPAGSLTAPRAVRKGTAVLITLEEGGLALSAPGKSMADGAMGEIVRIINVNSGKVIQAEVIGEGRVRATGAPARQDGAR